MSGTGPAGDRSLDGDQLTLHLTAAAHRSESTSRQAAVGLLAETGWLRRIVTAHPAWIIDEGDGPVDLDWRAMAVDAQSGRIPKARNGDLAVLSLALSLHLSGYLVPLVEIVTALDAPQTEAALRAVARAAGQTGTWTGVWE
ncbi:hypothetical protein [Streptomyces sp. NPDC056672]|uniref:hypothetical protein n=1 Tax=Streptomyces sp. NPDC056672 TaxID=3345906 RepID=UPI0036B2E769